MISEMVETALREKPQDRETRTMSRNLASLERIGLVGLLDLLMQLSGPGNWIMTREELHSRRGGTFLLQRIYLHGGMAAELAKDESDPLPPDPTGARSTRRGLVCGFLAENLAKPAYREALREGVRYAADPETGRVIAATVAAAHVIGMKHEAARRQIAKDYPGMEIDATGHVQFEGGAPTPEQLLDAVRDASVRELA